MSPRRPSGPSGKHRAAVALLLRATEEQRERWRAAATRDRRTLSDWLRCVADDAAMKKARPGVSGAG